MRSNSKTIIATGTAAAALMVLTACGPTDGAQQEPGGDRSIFDQPLPQQTPAPSDGDLDDTDTLTDADTLDDTHTDTTQP